MSELIEYDDAQLNRPLIVMSFITLLKYRELFKKNGFEYYFEKFYDVICKQSKSKEEVFNTQMSFDMFMGRELYNLEDEHKRLMELLEEWVKSKSA